MLMATPVEASGAGIPSALFQTRVPMLGIPYRIPYGVASDGQRFSSAPRWSAHRPRAIQILLDWRAAIAQRAKDR
jgi:hypothetical protein